VHVDDGILLSFGGDGNFPSNVRHIDLTPHFALEAAIVILQPQNKAHNAIDIYLVIIHCINHGKYLQCQEGVQHVGVV
jgi:hypothetical protein